MRYERLTKLLISGALAAAPLAGGGCEDLPGSSETQGAVIGGVAGGAAGAAIAEDNRLLGALIGAAVGAGGGYLIGAQVDKADDPDDNDREDAQEAMEEARRDPATVDDVRSDDDADLNDDGFVTTDEVVAMERAGLSDDEIIDRLEATDQVFELNRQQRDYLARQGVSNRVINAMESINADQRQALLEDRDVLGRTVD